MSSADQDDQFAALAVEYLVDDVAHDPCAECGRHGDGQQAYGGGRIAPDIFAAVLGENAPNDGNHLAWVGPPFLIALGCQIGSVRIASAGAP